MSNNSKFLFSFDGLDRLYHQHRESILEILDASLAKGERLRGDAVTKLERECARKAQRRHAIAVSSATDGLTIALMAIASPKTKVIVPAFSFIASASSVRLSGQTPAFADVRKRDLMMDLSLLEDIIDEDVGAIMFVQLFGACLTDSHYQQLKNICQKQQLSLIEDAAQAFGSSGSAPAGSYGDISVFSFDPTKVMPGIETGGVILTDDDDFADTARSLRCHGHDGCDFVRLGFNSQMANCNAEMLLWQFEMDDSWRLRRRSIASQYCSGLEDIPQIEIITPVKAEEGQSNFHKFVIQTSRRDDLKRELQKSAIPTKIHYAKSLSSYDFLDSRLPCPVADLAAQQVLSLPIHPFLHDEEIQLIVGSIRKFFYA